MLWKIACGVSARNLPLWVRTIFFSEYRIYKMPGRTSKGELKTYDKYTKKLTDNDNLSARGRSGRSGGHMAWSCVDKILADQRYKVESIYQRLEKAFLNYNLKKIQEPDGTICFVGNGNPKDYRAFGCIITSLKEKAWFMDCVIKWIWYNSDDGESEDDFVVKDVLYHYTRKSSIT